MISQFLRVRAEHLSACDTSAVAQEQISALSRRRSRTYRANFTSNEELKWQ